MDIRTMPEGKYTVWNTIQGNESVISIEPHVFIMDDRYYERALWRERLVRQQMNERKLKYDLKYQKRRLITCLILLLKEFL